MQNETIIKPREKFDTKESTLKGMPFISETIGNLSTPRTCASCRFRNANGEKDCLIPQAKFRFGYHASEILPSILDGKEVAQYCPTFFVY